MRRGELTVFFAMVFILIVALLSSLVEVSRRQGVRMQVVTATDAACESVFAEYDTKMLEKFKVFFYDGAYGANDSIENNILSKVGSDINIMLNPQDEMMGSYTDLYKISVNDSELKSVVLATDDEGMVFREQAILSVKDRYGISYAEDLLSKTDILKKNIEDGNSYKESEESNNEQIKSFEEQKAKIDEENKEAAQQAAANENPAAAVEVKKSLGILEIVKPDNYTVSQMQIDTSVMPSKRQLNKGSGMKSYSEDVLSDVLFNEYLFNTFSCAVMGEAEQENKKQNTQTNLQSNILNYQLEYLLSGKENDTDNLKAVAEKLLLIREGANFAYLLTDGIKTAQAETLAVTLVGYTGLVPLIEATKYAILASWAFAESCYDVKRLLSGKKVSVIKNSANWQLELSNISNLTSQELKDDSDGITYMSYLKLLLLLEPQRNIAKRCIDMVEMLMCVEEFYEEFKLDAMICEMKLKIKFYSDSVFYMLPFMHKYIWNPTSVYIAERSYSYNMWR